MRHRSILLLIPALAVFTLPGAAATTTLFNHSPANDCYNATLTDRARRDAVEICTVAIEQQGLPPESLAATYSNRGILLLREGQVGDALKDHDRAVAFNTGKSHMLINRANALVLVKRYREAMEDLNRAVEIADEALPAAHYNRSLLYFRLGDRASARVEAERAAELSPESEVYQDYLRELGRAEPDPSAGGV